MSSESRPNAIPEGYHTITPYLFVKGAAAAIDFYGKAFGAEELFRLGGPGEMIGHAEMRIGDSPFMLSDEVEEWENRSPLTLGGSAGLMMVYVEDVDAAFARALEAGATAIRPPENHFYGDRAGTLQDPFGHRWTLSTHVEDVPPDVMNARMKEMLGG